MPRTHFLLPILAAALTTGPAAQSHPIDLGTNYTYIRSNTGPDCGCFALNGGGALLQYGLNRHLAAVADLNVTPRLRHHIGGLHPHPDRLYLRSPLHPRRPRLPDPALRRVPRRRGPRLRHLAPSSTGLGGSNTFALQTGGGVRVLLTRRLTLEPIRADYLMTQFGNNANGRQNDFRISIGFLLRIKR